VIQANTMTSYKAVGKAFGIRLSITLFLTFLIVAVLNTNIREQIRSFFKPQNFRILLAVARGQMDDSNKIYQVLKVKTEAGLFLEIYNDQKFISSVRLPDTKDGFFTFNGQVTNLAIDDVDNDNKNEVLATSFDQDLVAHLNIYRFNTEKQQLEFVRLN
jgi:hypothetical protein